MKFGAYQVYDLYIFDLNENLVTELNTLKRFDLNYGKDDSYYVIAYDALMDEKLLKHIGKGSKQTDFDKILGRKNSISIGKTKGKQFKLIAKSLVRDADTKLDKEIVLEFPLVEMISQPSFLTDFNRVSEFDVAFKVIPQVDDEFYKIHM